MWCIAFTNIFSWVKIAIFFIIKYNAIIATIEREPYELNILLLLLQLKENPRFWFYLYFILNSLSNKREPTMYCSPLTFVQALAKKPFLFFPWEMGNWKKRENVGVIGCCKRQIDHAIWFSPILFLLAIEESQTSTCLEVT